MKCAHQGGKVHLKLDNNKRTDKLKNVYEDKLKNQLPRTSNGKPKRHAEC